VNDTERAKILARLKRELRETFPVVAEDRYVSCPICGQFYDVRDFTEVYYHDDTAHKPMKADA
jgi:hypothetical protein